MRSWFDGAAIDIFIAEGGVDDFDDLTPEELEDTIRKTLPNFIPMILESAKRLQGEF